ncbi:MAG: DNA mismatch repair protein MutS [Planctomycetota bacterium]|nr:MAG: DNA mismatch repair protein MutS [Planctomycetota bacterium]
MRELLFSETHSKEPPERVGLVLEALGISGTPRPAWQFRREEALEAIKTTFGVASLDGFGLSEDDPALPAAGAVIRYLRETQTPAAEATNGKPQAPTPTRPTRPYTPASARRSPTCSRPAANATRDAASWTRSACARSRSSGPSAAGATRSRARCSGSSCGPRPARATATRRWADASSATGSAARSPRPSPSPPDSRCVATLAEDRRSAAELGTVLADVQDVARIGGRIALARATPRDIVALGRSLDTLDRVRAVLAGAGSFAAFDATLAGVRESLAPLATQIVSTCVETPPAHLREGGLIRDGIDAELDEARGLQKDAGVWLASYQTRLAEEIGLAGCKVGYNSVFGYYIELTKVQARDYAEQIDRAALTRKQTLRNAERYITPELKEFEDKVTTAEARALAREQAIFRELCDAAVRQLRPVAAFGEAIASIDALLALADKAAHRGWVRPQVVESQTLTIHGGRHPVLDELLGADFVPNDTELGAAAAVDGSDRPALSLLTGPNMAGKSTFIRQVALLTLLAHTGSFIPADRATVGLCDRVFTRVGADDALHRGQSTFMVEMTETANILNHATERSLVILDEIGRGTSTLDGLSLAWAICEWLATERGPRTLFATHYHELTDLAEQLPERVANLQVSVREWTTADGHEEIVFLHRIEPGRADQSYGLHVAKLAGVPSGVVARAQDVLSSLSVERAGDRAAIQTQGPPAAEPERGQLSLFTEYVDHPAIAQLRELKLDGMTPLQAFDALRALRELTRDEA